MDGTTTLRPQLAFTARYAVLMGEATGTMTEFRYET